MQKNVWGYFRCPNGSDKEKGTDMKEMIKKMREERGGFTLAELLVVVAIVAVLVAICVAAAVYAVLLVALQALEREDILLLPGGRKLVKLLRME